ncbi:PREDICTED: chymotrypsin-1-like [Ceratosolen solmsi marchali]|uniref:Chymotrypsin-1-like n=1 Tax=Ceratosolen solmsi marchali TaxID=326594 RepID=A0AAJ7E1W4_9HYME|nr:PREDICTED: chymotrypsin-1-like [Ceratosolen solmsi marchali]
MRYRIAVFVFVLLATDRDVAENDNGFVLGWGSTTFPENSYPLQMQKADMRIIPERFYSTYFKFLVHDTQFCVLDKKGVGTWTVKHVIVFNNYQNMIDLPDRDIDDEDSGYVLGWGSISHPNNTFPMQLQKAYMYIYPLRDCFEIYSLETAVGQFCAYYKENVGPCIGDSGGPLVINKKLAGVVSFSMPCAQGIPDFYTNVYYYLDFIRFFLK